MSAFQLYLLLKLDMFIGFFGTTGGLLLGYLVVLLILWGACSLEDSEEKPKKLFLSNLKWVFPVGMLFVIIAILLPSTKQVAIIYVVPKIVNNSQVQAIPGKMLTLADEWLDKLRPENIKESAKTVVQQPQHKSTAVDSGK